MQRFNPITQVNELSNLIFFEVFIIIFFFLLFTWNVFSVHRERWMRLRKSFFQTYNATFPFLLFIYSILSKNSLHSFYYFFLLSFLFVFFFIEFHNSYNHMNFKHTNHVQCWWLESKKKIISNCPYHSLHNLSILLFLFFSLLSTSNVAIIWTETQIKKIKYKFNNVMYIQLHRRIYCYCWCWNIQ